MPIQSYEEANLLFNSNFTEDLGDSKVAYRGELILIPGEIADAQGRCKPPLSLLLGAVLLQESEKLTMIVGQLNDVAELAELDGRYGTDFAEDMLSMIFVRNIGAPLKVKTANAVFTCLPYSEGIAWNEAIDELALEKSDFKGLSAGTKLVRLKEELADYRFKGDEVSFDQALEKTIEVKMVARGPV